MSQSELDAFYNDNKMPQQAQSTLPFEQSLQNQGYSADQYKQEVLSTQVAQQNLLGKAVTTSPAEIQANYSSNTMNYSLPNSVHVHRTATSTKDAATAIYQSLKSGKKMSDLASSNIAAEGAGAIYDGTDIAQWINIDNPAPVLKAAAPALQAAKAGDVVAPFQVQSQWWVVQVVDNKPKQVLPLSQVQDLVKINVVRQKAGQQGFGAFEQPLHDDLARHYDQGAAVPEFIAQSPLQCGHAGGAPAPASPQARPGTPVVLPGGCLVCPWRQASLTRLCQAESS